MGAHYLLPWWSFTSTDQWPHVYLIILKGRNSFPPTIQIQTELSPGFVFISQQFPLERVVRSVTITKVVTVNCWSQKLCTGWQMPPSLRLTGKQYSWMGCLSWWFLATRPWKKQSWHMLNLKHCRHLYLTHIQSKITWSEEILKLKEKHKANSTYRYHHWTEMTISKSTCTAVLCSDVLFFMQMFQNYLLKEISSINSLDSIFSTLFFFAFCYFVPISLDENGK